MNVPIYSLTNNKCIKSCWSTFCPILGIIRLLNFFRLKGYQVVSHCGLLLFIHRSMVNSGQWYNGDHPARRPWDLMKHRMLAKASSSWDHIIVLFSSRSLIPNMVPHSYHHTRKRDNRLGGTSLVVQTVKNLLATQETRVWSVDLEDPLVKGIATAPVFLSGESHGQRSLVGYSPGGPKSWTRLSD